MILNKSKNIIISHLGLIKTDITGRQEPFSNEYSDQTTIHLAENHINFRYFDNLDLFKDYNGIAEYKELDATSWLWPNYSNVHWFEKRFIQYETRFIQYETTFTYLRQLSHI